MTNPQVPSAIEQAGAQLMGWARGEPTVGPVAVVEQGAAVQWLHEQGHALLSEDGLVLCALPRRAELTVPTGPGVWLRGTGAMSSPGDDVGLSRDLYVQTTDYSAHRYLSVIGPTVLRLFTVEDATAFCTDVASALTSGAFPEALLHPLVEIGDRCAIAGGPCPGRSLGRLHVDRDGVVRTSPVGRQLGKAGDDPGVLREAASRSSDPCLQEDVGAVVAPTAVAAAAFLAGLDAARVLAQRSRSTWSMVGWQKDLFGGPGCDSPRADQFLLSDGTNDVLYDNTTRRAFRLERPAAEVAEAVLMSGDDAAAAQRLHERGRDGVSVDDVQRFREEFRSRGLELAHAGA